MSQALKPPFSPHGMQSQGAAGRAVTCAGSASAGSPYSYPDPLKDPKNGTSQKSTSLLNVVRGVIFVVYIFWILKGSGYFWLAKNEGIDSHNSPGSAILLLM